MFPPCVTCFCTSHKVKGILLSPQADNKLILKPFAKQCNISSAFCEAVFIIAQFPLRTWVSFHSTVVFLIILEPVLLFGFRFIVQFCSLCGKSLFFFSHYIFLIILENWFIWNKFVPPKTEILLHLCLEWHSIRKFIWPMTIPYRNRGRVTFYHGCSYG